jgi:hypothetical protein
MPRKARKPAATAPSTGCTGVCLDVECPTCWGWIEKILVADDWFGLTNPKPHPTRIIIDLDEPTFAVLQREAADHKTPIETVVTVLLREWTEGKAERVPRREAFPPLI